ncbi:myoneurin-like isoform X2 [Rhinoraja longicauda]
MRLLFAAHVLHCAAAAMQQVHHCKQLLDQLQRQRMDGFLCDCTVVIGQLQFKAHHNVLAAFSNYFRAVCGHSLDTDVVFLDHNRVSSEGFQKLLDFVYTGHIHIDGCNAPAIQAAAVYLQMEEVLRICEAKMERFVNLETGVKVSSDQVDEEPDSCSPSAGTKVDIVRQGPASLLGCEEALLPVSEVDCDLKIEELQLQSKRLDTLSGSRETKEVKTDLNVVLQVSDVSELKCTRLKARRVCSIRKRQRRVNDVSVPQADAINTVRPPHAASHSILCSDYQKILTESKMVPKTNGKQNRRRLRNGLLSEKSKSRLPGGQGCAESEHSRKLLKMKPMCNMCGKVFSEASSLRRHMRIHKGLKPYVCQLCAKAFTQSNQLKTHVRTHTGEKPYQCDMCDKSFAQKCQLVFHNRMHHGEKKPYSCDVCNLQFATSSNLKIHARKHSGEKPYVCDRCGQRFAQASTLTYHVRRHTGEKPYICDICGKAFAVSSSLITHARKHTGELNKHTRSHTGEKPFVCELCGNSYSDVKNLKKHNSKAHAVNRADRSDEGAVFIEQGPQEDSELNLPLSVAVGVDQQQVLFPMGDGPSLSTEHLLRPPTYPETQLIFLQQLY